MTVTTGNEKVERLKALGSKDFRTPEERDAFIEARFPQRIINDVDIPSWEAHWTLPADGYLASVKDGFRVYWQVPTTAAAPRPEFLEAWLAIGRTNLWIREANDPPFTEKSFRFCADREELADFVEHGNWCLGQAFTLGDLCFINQVDGDGEWLVIRREISFESLTYPWFGKTPEARREVLFRYLDGFEAASDDELRSHTYGLRPKEGEDSGNAVTAASVTQLIGYIRGGQ